MSITQQQALHAVDRLRGAEPAQHLATLRQYIEQSTAQPQAVVPAPVAWALGDARYVHATNLFPAHEFTPDAEYAEEWTPLYDHPPMQTQPSAQAERAPVVQAVQAGELVEQEMSMLIRRLCSTTANDKTRAQAMEYLFKRGHASPLRADSDPAQAMDHPPLPEGVKARFKCEDCDGTGYTGEMIPGSEFQPPEPVGCTSCRFTGWWAECEAYSADQMRAYVDADRASSCAAQAAPFAKDSWQHAVDNQLVAFGRTSQEFANPHEALAWLAIVNMELGQSNVGAAQAVRVLTREELNDVALSEKVGWGPGEYVEAVQRKFAEVNGLRIPADGKIGGAA